MGKGGVGGDGGAGAKKGGGAKESRARNGGAGTPAADRTSNDAR